MTFYQLGVLHSDIRIIISVEFEKELEEMMAVWSRVCTDFSTQMARKAIISHSYNNRFCTDEKNIQFLNTDHIYKVNMIYCRFEKCLFV